MFYIRKLSTLVRKHSQCSYFIIMIRCSFIKALSIEEVDQFVCILCDSQWQSMEEVPKR